MAKPETTPGDLYVSTHRSVLLLALGSYESVLNRRVNNENNPAIKAIHSAERDKTRFALNQLQALDPTQQVI